MRLDGEKRYAHEESGVYVILIILFYFVLRDGIKRKNIERVTYIK